MSYARLHTANLAFTNLTVGISSSSTALTLVDPLSFPDEGPFKISIGSEIIKVGNISTTGSGLCTTLTRGDEGTVAAAHDTEATVANKLTAGTIEEVFDGVDEAIAAVTGKVDKTGSTMTGDLNFGSNKAQNVVVEGGSLHDAFNFDSNSAQNIVIEGGSLLDAFDANHQEISQAVIKDYAETVKIHSNTTAGITIDLSEGNIHKVPLTGTSTSARQITISNPSSIQATSFTMELLSHGEYALIWPAPHVVVTSSTLVSASTADNSFNHSSSAFDTGVEAGDVIAVAGFTATANNTTWRVKTATANKIELTEAVTTEAAGQSISITRQKINFLNQSVPDAPDPFVPKVFTGYTKDGDRWNILDVGEF